jgi:hypothetical protein
MLTTEGAILFIRLPSSVLLRYLGSMIRLAATVVSNVLLLRDGYHIPLLSVWSPTWTCAHRPWVGYSSSYILLTVVTSGIRAASDEFSVADLPLDYLNDTGDQDPRVNDFGQYTGNLGRGYRPHH